MYKIKTFNNISDIVNDYLKAPDFSVGSEGDSFDGVLVRSADLHETALPKELLAIARAGAGVNNIPIDACNEQGVVVFNTPGANANAVKELVICALLLAGRDVVAGVDWLRDEARKGTTGIDKLAEKAKNNFVGPEVTGKRLGVIGLGAIGVLVANAACNGLGMEVVGYDPFMSVEAAWHLTRAVQQAKDIDEIFRTCDFITIHIPLNDKTRNTVDAQQLAMMKDGAVLLNFARGGLVNDDAVLAALEAGKLAHYVTDFPNDKIVGEKGVIAVPHLGASTPESEENCAAMAAQELRDYILTGNIRNSVNLPDCEMPKNGFTRLAVINRNVTNMVGQITSILASHGINIEHMLNKSRGAYAYTIIDLAVTPTDACVEALRGIDGIIRVRII
ncbi:MAG: phosphoglycerate dehydrogenase [Oscillospiraceae bacterium]|nr:phosphoglycerate dehydrogenase [Oscillospiraceae bacterium]